jgi:phosphoinositide-3-kinase regulatory subunit 4
MIALDPATRPSFDVLLHTSRGKVFPESFYSFLHNYVASINEPGSVSAFTTAISSTLQIPSLVTSPAGKTAGGPPISIGNDINSGALPNDSDNRMDRIWVDYESVEMYAFPAVPQERGGITVEWSSTTTYSVRCNIYILFRTRGSSFLPRISSQYS